MRPPLVAYAHRPSPRDDDGHFDRATNYTAVAHENRNRGYENSFHTFSRIPEPGFWSYWVTDRRLGVGTGRVNRERDSGAVRSGEERLNESLFVPFHRCNLLVIFVREYILPLLKEIGMLILSIEKKIKVSTNRI